MDRNIMDTITENLFTMLPTLHATVNIAKYNASTEFSRSHHEILYVLHDVGLLTMSKISKLLYVSKPQVTNLIDKLISQELVERIPDKNDRRVINIKITEKGEIVFEEHKNELRENAEYMLSFLSDNEIELVSSALQNLKDLLQKANKEGYKEFCEDKK